MDISNQQSLRLTLGAIEELAFRALLAHGASESNARVVACSIAAAEADGLRSHGLMRLTTYCEHVACKKVNGAAVPSVKHTRPGVIVVDAHEGFAHSAIDVGLFALIPVARNLGIATLGIINSYNCGVVGHHVERLAKEGLVALAFANTPKAIAPWGGKEALFGTNPLAFAVPREAQPPLVIDQSSSVVARGEVMLRANQGKDIPSYWALDAEGQPTTDARAALSGSMLPAGGYKGAGIALLVEVLAAALTGATASYEATSFADNLGGPPRTGQCFIAIDPSAFGTGFDQRIEHLFKVMCSQPGVRLPGSKRTAARETTKRIGVEVDGAFHQKLLRLGQV